MSIKSPPMLHVIPRYAESVAQVMVVTCTPKAQRKFACLHSHPFVDNIAQECNVVHRVGEECVRMEYNMDNQSASTQDSTWNVVITIVVLIFVRCFGLKVPNNHNWWI